MDRQQADRVIKKAKTICDESGVRLTQKRKRIFEIMLLAGMPLSAYEIADLYNNSADGVMPPMSVYRILDFLESEDLVHRLNSNNKYVTCAHLNCGQKHEISQFLICGNCDSATEISMSSKVMNDIKALVKNAGFSLKNPQIELECICDDCSASFN